MGYGMIPSVMSMFIFSKLVNVWTCAVQEELQQKKGGNKGTMDGSTTEGSAEPATTPTDGKTNTATSHVGLEKLKFSQQRLLYADVTF